MHEKCRIHIQNLCLEGLHGGFEQVEKDQWCKPVASKPSHTAKNKLLAWKHLFLLGQMEIWKCGIYAHLWLSGTCNHSCKKDIIIYHYTPQISLNHCVSSSMMILSSWSLSSLSFTSYNHYPLNSNYILVLHKLDRSMNPHFLI